MAIGTKLSRNLGRGNLSNANESANGSGKRSAWRRAAALALAVGGMTLGHCRSANAASYTWDPAGLGTGSDGAGTWDTMSSLWTGPGGPPDTTWLNDGTATAVFGSGGTADTVTLGTAINAAGITFNSVASGNYNIAGGGNTITFMGLTPTIMVNSGLAPTISAPLAGSAPLVVTEGGTALTLSGSNAAFTGGMTVNGGQLNFSSDASLGSSASTLTLNSSILNYTGTASLTQSRGFTLSNASDTINIANTGVVDTITGAISGGGNLVVIGGGQVTLNPSGNNTFGGTNAAGLTINGTQVNYSKDAAGNYQLGGSGASGVTILNGGVLDYTGATNINSRVLTFGTGGGTIDLASSGLGGGLSKLTIAAGQISSGSVGPITTQGPGYLTISGSNIGYTGAGASWTVNGPVEVSNANGLGASTVPVTVNPLGELVIKSAITLPNPVTLSGGIISNETASVFGGSLNVTANSFIRLGYFYTNTNSSTTISGNITGSGNLTFLNSALINVPATGLLSQATPNNQSLTLTGNNSGYTGTLTVDGGHIVRFNNSNSILSNITAVSSAYALPTLTLTPGQTVLPAVTSTGTGEGVVGWGGGTMSTATTVNLATYGGGKWFLGSDNGVSLFNVTIDPGANDAAGHPAYRLVGGSGGMFLGTGGMLNNFGSTVTDAIFGDPRIGGAGTIKVGNKMTYTGNTTVNSGGTLQLDFVANAITSALLSSNSTLVLNGGVVNDAPQTGVTSVDSQTVNGIIVNALASSIQITDGAVNNSTGLITGAITRNVGATVDFTLPAGTQSSTNGIYTLTANTANNILGGWATVGGANWAVSGGTGTANGSITALSTYTTTTSAGVTAATYSNANVDVTNSAGTLNGVITPNSLRFNTAGAETLTLATGNNVIASGGILVTSTVGANNSNISGGTLQGAAGADLIVINNDTSNVLIINSIIADNTTATALTKSGAGALTLGGANTFTGGVILNAGQINYSSDANLGAAGKSITLNGGTLNYSSGTQINDTRTFVVNNPTTFNDSGKYLLSAGLLTGTGALIKTGTAQFDLNGDNPGFTGTIVVNGGTVSADTPNGAGANGGTVMVYTGEFAIGNEAVGAGIANPVNLTMYGGIFSGVNSTGTGSNFSGAVNIAGFSEIRLGDFYQSVNRNLTISGTLTGNGNLALIEGGSAAASGQTLFITGNTTGYTGTLAVSAGHNVAYNVASNVLANFSIASSATALGGIGIAYDPNSSPAAANTGLPVFTNLTGTFGGVLGINTTDINTPINLATLYGGSSKWFLGSQTTGTYSAPSLTPSADNNYRLGGGGGTLNVTTVLADTASPAGALINSSLINGGGTVELSTSNTYSNGTTVQAGILELGTNPILSGGAIVSGPVGTGTLTLNGGSTVDDNGTAITLANNVYLNGNASLGSIATGTLTVTGVIGGASGAGIIKTGAGLVNLSGANTYVGPTTVNAGTLQLGNQNALGPNNFQALAVNGGTLDLNAMGNTSPGNYGLSMASLSGNSISGVITDNSPQTGTTTLTLASSTTTYIGAINNGPVRTVALTQNGPLSNTLTLTNPTSNFSGGTTINSGSILSTTPGSIGTGQVTLNGGTLIVGQGVSGFGSTGSGWNINTEGTFTNITTAVTSNVLTLTDSSNINQGRQAFFKTAQDLTNAGGWTASFTYSINAAAAADGFTFDVENDSAFGSNVTGGAGGSLGVSNLTANTGEVAFNLYTAAAPVSQTGYDTNGAIATPNNMSTGGINFHGGDLNYGVSLSYNGTNNTLTETVTDLANSSNVYMTTYTGVNFNTILGGNSGYVGFTGSDGGAVSTQQISNFTFLDGAGSTWGNSLNVSYGSTSGLQVGVGSATLGSLTMQSFSTLNVSPAPLLGANTSYGVTTGAVSVSGTANFNVSNSGTSVGTLILGAVNDGGSASTLNISGTGAVAFSAPATSLVDGTAVNVNGAINVNAPGALGTQADITVATGGAVTLAANQSFGALNGGGSVNLNANALTVGGSSSINTNSTYAGKISGAGMLNVGGGTVLLSGSNNYSGGTLVSAGALTIASPTAFPIFTSLTINPGALVQAQAFTTTKNNLFVNGLSIAGSTGHWTGTLDLANNDMVVRGGSIATVTNQIAQGYNGGNWNGTGGIVSTAAAGDATYLHALGVIQNDDGTGSGIALYSTFDGQAVGDADVLVKYTYYGDTDLNGTVDGTDYSRIDNAFFNNQNSSNPQLSGWFNGDFNYDNVIDGSDYTLIDNTYNTQGASISAQIAAQVGGSSAVPEPASLGLLAMSAVGLLGRRKARRSH